MRSLVRRLPARVRRFRRRVVAMHQAEEAQSRVGPQMSPSARLPVEILPNGDPNLAFGLGLGRQNSASFAFARDFAHHPPSKNASTFSPCRTVRATRHDSGSGIRIECCTTTNPVAPASDSNNTPYSRPAV